MRPAMSAPRPAVVVLAAAVLVAACVPGSRAPRVAPRGTLAPSSDAPGESRPSGPVQVAFAAPRGSTTSPSEVSLSFDRPMRALGPEAVGVPVSLAPTVDGRWEWLGTRAVRFTPKAPLPAATSFVVTVPAGTRALDGTVLASAFTQSFTTPLPTVVRVTPRADEGGVEPGQKVRLWFNQDVADAEISRAVTVRGPDGKPRPFRVERPEKDDRSVVELAPAPLPLDSQIAVEVDPTLRGVEGPLPAGAPFHTTFTTYGPFVGLSVSCSEDAGRCNPDGWVAVELSNAVKLADLKKAVSVEPPVKLRWGAWMDERDASSSRVDLDGAFLPGRSYTVRVRAKLPSGEPVRDVHGQPLSRDFSQKITFGDLAPRVQLGVDGTYLEPALATEIPLFSVNAGSIGVAVAPLGEADVVKIASRNGPMPDAASLPGAVTRTVEPRAARNTLHRASVALPKRRGPAVVTLTSAASQSTDIVQVTDLGITAKASTEGVWAMVTRLSTGQPVVGATVEVLAEKRVGPPVQGRTDERGVTHLATGVSPDERSAIVVARDGDDWAYRLVDDALDPWRLGATSSCRDCERTRALVFTDRGIYRPGDSVHVKAVARGLASRGLSSLGGTAVSVEVQGPDGEKVASFDETMTTFGSFAHAFTVPAGAKLGRYNVQAGPVSLDKKARKPWSTSFEVAEYRPTELAVTATSDRPSYIRGEQMRCDVRGNYLFGAPMARAAVHTTITRASSSFSPDGTDGFSTDDPYTQERDATPRAGEVKAENGTLDERGSLGASAKLDLPGQHGTEAITCEAEVTDVSRQTGAGRGTALVHPAEFYVALRAPDGFSRAGESLSPEVLAVEPKGKHRTGVTVRLGLVQRTWKVAREAVGTRYRSEITTVDSEVASCQVTTQDKPTGCALKPPAAGFFFVRATSADPRGNRVSAARGVYVLGDGTPPWADSDDRTVEIVPDRKSYKVGDVAHLLVKSPLPRAEAWITVEREGVVSERRVTLAGATPTIDVPITEEMVPSAYVGVHLVRGRTKPQPAKDSLPDVGAPTFRAGYAQLSVDAESHRLKVAVKPQKTDQRPGETAEIDLDVKDAAGKGTAAEVTVFAVDEGVLSLIGYRTPDPFAVFFAPRPLGVTTVESREAMARVQRGPHGFGPGVDKGLEGGGGGEGPRRDFRQTALFLPRVLTDANGHAHASFKLPDGLTTYRLMAVAATASDGFGSAEARIVTSKPLMVRPALPRVLRAGDRVEASVIVTAKAVSGTIDVTIAVEGATLLGDARRSVQVDVGESREVRFPIEARRAGKTRLRFSASGGGASDSVEVTRDVVSPTVLESAALSGDTDSVAGEALGDLTAVRDDVGGLSVGLSSTALAGLAGGLEQLIEYPYGCTEQLTSRLVPLLSLRELATQLGVALPADVDGALAATVGKVLANQRADGSFGLWRESTSGSPFLTAYALWGLLAAERHGIPVRKSALEAATRSLRAALPSAQMQRDPVATAFALDVLAEAGDPDPGAATRLFERRADLPPTARAELLHAMAIAHGDREPIDELVRDLEALVRTDGGDAHVVVQDDPRARSTLDSSTRAGALTLRALVAARPRHPMSPKLARGLLAERKGGRFRTTQEAAWALVALDAYRRAEEPASPSFDVRVFLGEASIFEAAFHDSKTLTVQRTFPMSDVVSSGGSVLAIEKKGDGRVFYDARLRFARKDPSSDPIDHGFYVEKSTQIVTPESLQAALGVASIGLLPRVPAGSLVLVDVTVVAPSPRDFVVIDDPLPAGLEAVDSRLATTSSRLDVDAAQRRANDDDDDGDDYSYQRPLYTRRELRDDRVVFFVDHLPAGVFHYRYLARATSIGRFAAPAARVEEMYIPETFGAGRGTTLEVVAP